MKTENLHKVLLFCKTNALIPHTLDPKLVQDAIDELSYIEASEPNRLAGITCNCGNPSGRVYEATVCWDCDRVH